MKDEWKLPTEPIKFFNPFEDAKISYVDENGNEITNSKDPLCDIKLAEYRAAHRDFYYPKKELFSTDKYDIGLFAYGIIICILFLLFVCYIA